MTPILVLFLTILIFTAATIGAIWLMYQLLTNFQPGSNKISKDLLQMREEISVWISDLVPWDANEMELLSLNHINKTIKKGITTTAKGVITSIYHEPMIAWAYKKYFATSENAILYARTSHHEFVYRIKKNSAQVMIDNQNVGEIRADGRLYSSRSSRPIAQLKERPTDGLLPIVVGERELGSLSSRVENMKGSTRAFQLLSEELSNEEEALMLSLSVLEMVRREVPAK